MSVETNASIFSMVDEASEDMLLRKKENRFKRERERIRCFKYCNSKGDAGIGGLPLENILRY